MIVQLHQLAAALYLAAGLAAGLGLALPLTRLLRVAVAILAVGALIHGFSFSLFHEATPPVPLTDHAAAVSLMAWIAVLFSIVLLARARLLALTALVAPAGFLGTFFAALQLAEPAPTGLAGSGSLPHAHVLLASAGLSLLGVAGLAGALFLGEHRRLKSKRPVRFSTPLPSLEALDRANRVALALGFPLLTLGVASGMLWFESSTGRFWTGSTHETWSAVAWMIYAVLVAARFGTPQGSRRAAASAVCGFVFLFFAVIGVELFA